MQSAKISGFGGILKNEPSTPQDNPPTCTLKEAYLKVIPCETLLPEEYLDPKTIPNPQSGAKWRSNKICLHHGDIFPPATACAGDSGGPLIANQDGLGDFKSIVIGVSSFLYDGTENPLCGTEKPVSVYAEVQAYLPWIKSTIGEVDDGVCPESFETIDGSSIAIPRGGIKIRPDLNINLEHKSCSSACKNERDCCAFEWSEVEKMCNLHHYCRTKPEKYRDFITCRKKGQIFNFLSLSRKPPRYPSPSKSMSVRRALS